MDDKERKPMTFFVRRCLLMFMIFELLIFCVVYCFGPKGLKTYWDIGQMCVQVDKDIILLEKEIESLQGDIAQHQTSFAKEKIARERLLMKRDDEIVYFK